VVTTEEHEEVKAIPKKKKKSRRGADAERMKGANIASVECTTNVQTYYN
jgi:hypothetical protein